MAMANYSLIGRSCIGPGGAPYSRHHIMEVLKGNRRASKELAAQLVACGAISSRRKIRVSPY